MEYASVPRQAYLGRDLDQPLTVSPEQFGRVLRLQYNPISWSQISTGFMSFYVRTPNFTPHQLLDVISKFLSSG